MYDKKFEKRSFSFGKKNWLQYLSFGSQYQNLVSVVHYSKISDFPNEIIDFGSQCLLEASNVVPRHIRMLC